ncbi:hypothetical protein ACWGIR_22900 [Streptomyces albidoflavus]
MTAPLTLAAALRLPTTAPDATTTLPADARRHPLCDCGACCDACGHTGCTSQSAEAPLAVDS